MTPHITHFKNMCIALPAHFDLQTYCPLCKRIWNPETTLKLKKVWPLLHLSWMADVRFCHCLFFAKSNHIIHACRHHLNTSLICPCVRMVIQLISTSVLTSQHNTLQTMIQHIYSTLPLKFMNIVQVLSWNLQ